MTGLFQLWTVFIPLLAILVACSPQSEDSPSTAGNRILKIGNGGEPRDLDPHVVTGVPEVNIINALMEGLVTYHPDDDSIPYPGVAKSWDVSNGGKTWTFHLRENLHWSNGDPHTAHDFVYSWRRALNPSLGCEYADWFYMIVGAEDYNKGKIQNPEKIGIKTTGDHTLVINLKEPMADFLNILLNHSFLPVHPPSIEKFGGPGRRMSGWTRPQSYVGNGAFQLNEWKPDSYIEVTPNPHYWDADVVQLDAIRFFPISDENTEIRAFKSGQLHITNTVPVNRRSWYRDNAPDKIRFDPYAGVYYYRINITRPALKNPKVREALSLAIDRGKIVNNLLNGGERIAYAMVPEGIAGYQPPRITESNPARARKSLNQAGFPNGQGLPEIEILYNTSDNHRKIAEAIQHMWRTELGIDATLTNQEWQVYLENSAKMNYDISRSGWIGSLYPASFLRIFMSDSPNNRTGFNDPTFDQLITTAQQTLDTEKQHRLLHEAESRLLNSHAVIPLYWYTNVFLIDPAVQNWNVKLLNQRPYKFVRLNQ